MARKTSSSKTSGPSSGEKELARQMGDDLVVALLDSGSIRRAGEFHAEERGKQCTIKPTILVRRGKADELSYHLSMTETITSASIERKLAVRRGQLNLFTGEVSPEDEE